MKYVKQIKQTKKTVTKILEWCSPRGKQLVAVALDILCVFCFFCISLRFSSDYLVFLFLTLLEQLTEFSKAQVLPELDLKSRQVAEEMSTLQSRSKMGKKGEDI